MNDFLLEFPLDVYSIAHFDLGICIHGKVPEHDLIDLELMFLNKYRLNYFDHEIARFFGAQYCYTTIEKGTIWKERLGI